jgi:adenylosuccinate lyase
MIHVENLIQAIRYKAQEHRDTVMIGRSHGIHAEPMTFGFKLAGWLAEMLRHRERLTILQDRIAVGQISGAVGTYANIDPKIEALPAKTVGLNPDTASTQVISRDIHAEFMNGLALLGASIERFAWKFATCSAPMCWKLKNFSLKSRRALRPCPTSATPLSQSG